MTVAQDLQDYINQYGISQGAVARAIGKSTAVINQYLQKNTLVTQNQLIHW